MWFQPKNIHFGYVVHKLCPKTPKFCWFGAKWDLPITSQETTFWVMWVLFMDLEHQNNVICTFRHPFLVYGSGLLPNCLRTRNGSSPRKCECPNFDFKFLVFKDFSQQTDGVQTERVHPRESRKNIISWVISCLRLQIFPPIFSPVFSRVNFLAFLYFLTYRVDFYGFGIDF